MEFVGSPITAFSPELAHCFPLLLLRSGSADMLRPLNDNSPTRPPLSL